MPAAPRIAPIDPEQLSDAQRDVLAPVLEGQGPRATNLYYTLARHPSLFRRWQALGGTFLFRGQLSPRDREILVLRTAYNTGSDYEWGQHVLLGEAAGLHGDEIARCARADRDGAGWNEDDAALVAAADELHATSSLSDATWRELAGRYDEAQLIEIIALVGYYHQAAFLLNALGVEREPGVVGLPEVGLQD